MKVIFSLFILLFIPFAKVSENVVEEMNILDLIVDIHFNKPKVFVYELILFNSDNIVLRQDTIGLFCSNLKYERTGQFVASWSFLKKDGIDSYNLRRDLVFSNEGIFLSNTLCMIHPPRFSYLKPLQFSPYLYFKKGNKWEWNFTIGSFWAIDSSYAIKSNEDFKIK